MCLWHYCRPGGLDHLGRAWVSIVVDSPAATLKRHRLRSSDLPAAYVVLI